MRSRNSEKINKRKILERCKAFTDIYKSPLKFQMKKTSANVF